MNGTFTVEKINRNSVDTVLLAALILLIGIGLSVLFSSSYYYSELKFGEPTFFFKKQIVKVLIGIVLIIFVLKTPVSFLRKLAPILILFSLILTSLTFVPGIG
ncbi:MAG: putative lipid II flippase FtsW, partial [Spirochaetes bacterium]